MAQMARAGEAEGSKRPGVAEGEAWATGLPSESFDVVNIRHVLAHDTPGDVRRILRHSLDLLVPGGRSTSSTSISRAAGWIRRTRICKTCSTAT